ncbi:MAG TPA: PQQ-binding-like beta-propeller repeat protein, partial [Candidatus Binataceae bacterium]|nr:PQQ-binding-like beta-propeller repeat protein [Candidatus Binataceae bacterium]
MSRLRSIQLFTLSRCLGLTAIVVLCLSGLASAAPALTLNKTVGPPTTQLNVAGAGFGLAQPVDVFFDTSDLFLMITDGAGAFSASLKVPAAALPGTHWITAIQRGSVPQVAAQKSFLVRSDWPQFRNGPLHKGVSPFENVINPANVSLLAETWVASTTGAIPASPAIANGVAYVASFDHKLYAFNATTGTLASGWPRATGGPIGSSPA